MKLSTEFPHTRSTGVGLIRRVGIAAACTLLGVTVVADTGSPPPPAIVIGAPQPATKGQIKTYQEVVAPSYLASLPNGIQSDSFPMFLMFVAVFPCSSADRAVFCHLYLEERQVLVDL